MKAEESISRDVSATSAEETDAGGNDLFGSVRPDAPHPELASSPSDHKGVVRAAGQRELEQLRRCGFDLSQFEPFVSAKVVGIYLDIDPALAVRYAACGRLPAHPLPETDGRTHWRFLLSELRDSMMTRTGLTKRRNVRNRATGTEERTNTRP